MYVNEVLYNYTNNCQCMSMKNYTTIRTTVNVCQWSTIQLYEQLSMCVNEELYNYTNNCQCMSMKNSTTIRATVNVCQWSTIQL